MDKVNVISKINVDSELFVLFGVHYASLLVLSHSSLEEVCLALEGDHLHPIEGVFTVPDFGNAKGMEESIGHTFNVLNHELS
jgi:hypothetical protein